MNKEFIYNSEETEDEYLQRLYTLKEQSSLTWADIRDIANEELGYDYSSDKYRKDAYRYLKGYTTENYTSNVDLDEQILEMRVERTKLADERNNLNAVYRRIAREDSIKDIAREAVANMNEKFKLTAQKIPLKKIGNKEAVLEISDWHYGIEIDSYFNKYNPDVAKERIAKLRDQVINICQNEGINNLHVVNLGDLIAGRIHMQLRVNSRFDVITQIMEVSELLAQMLNDFANYFHVDYYDTLDNHSRLEPNLKESLDLESLTRITTWYIKGRVPGVDVHNNIYTDDIITFKALGYNIAGVHGHRDKQTKVIDSLTTMTKQHYDLILTSHLHHFSCEEKNETVLISNSSLMGTDDYAMTLRLNAKPSQTLIIMSKDNPTENIYKINLD